MDIILILLCQYLLHFFSCIFQEWARSVNRVCQWSIAPEIADGAELIDPNQLIPIVPVSRFLKTILNTLGVMHYN